MTRNRGQRIITESKLRGIYDKPSDRAIAKQLNHLDQYCQQFIKLSPFVLLATTDRKGRIDVSPRGGAPGFVHCADDHTLYLPDRRGNNRLDSLTNIVQTTNVGLLFMVPGFIECVRVAGSALIYQEAEILVLAEDEEKPPVSIIQVTVEEAFFQCGKSLIRSRLWNPETRVDRNVMPGLGRILREQTTGRPVSDQEGEVEDKSIEEAYRNRLY